MASNERKIVIPHSNEIDRNPLTAASDRTVSKFFYAADTCDNERVLDYLRDGVSINSHNMIGRTVFHIAAANGNLSLIEVLITWPRRDINLQTFDFLLSPLHEAVLAERTEIVECLLKAGAKVNLVNGSGETAVHMAVKLNAVQILKALIAYKASLNIVDVYSNTPLSLATLDTRNQYICILLLRRGARVNKSRPSALYLFHEAVLGCLSREDLNFLKVLVRYGAAINFIDRYGRNALHYGAITGVAAVVKYLLDIGVRLDVQDKTSRTPLDIAFDHEHAEIIEIIRLRLGTKSPDSAGQQGSS